MVTSPVRETVARQCWAQTDPARPSPDKWPGRTHEPEIKDATLARFHYESHEQLRTHRGDFMAACNLARRQKTLNGFTPYE